MCLLVLGVALLAANSAWVNPAIAEENLPATLEIETVEIESEDPERRGSVLSDEEESARSDEIAETSSKLKLSGRKLRAKQRQVQAVVLLFMAVVFLGIGMMVVILLYGSWIRRMNRKRSQVPSLADELAKLKASSKEGPEESGPASQSGMDSRSSSSITKK